VPYTQYVDDNIFRPLGMSETTFHPASNGDVARGHRLFMGRLRNVPERVVVKSAAGGAFSSIDDMLRFAAELASPSKASVVSVEGLSAMYQPEVLLGDRVPFQGLCFFLGNIGGSHIAFHAGDFPGYEAALFVAPGEGIGVVVLCNSSARGAALRLARRFMTLTLGVEEPVSSAAAAIDPAIARQVTGTYVAAPGFTRNLRVLAMTGGRVSVKTTEDGLTMRGRFGVLRRRVLLLPKSAGDPLRFQFMLRGFPYEGVPMEAVFLPGSPDGSRRLDLGLIGAQLHRR
jgi:CubicO group peptidase (beta-lactamase class C family)